MQDKGDGSHNGRNRPNFPLIPSGNDPPAEQRYLRVQAWAQVFWELLDWLLQRDHQQNAGNNNENHGNVDHDDDIYFDVGSIDHHNVVNLDPNNENAEDVGAVASDGVGVNQGVERDDPLPGLSRRRSREEDNQERSRKRCRLGDDSDTDTVISDSDTDNDCNAKNTDENAGNSPAGHAGSTAEVTEDDLLPVPSCRRSTEEDGQAEERSRKRFRLSDVASDSGTEKTDRDFKDTDETFGSSPAEHAGESVEAAKDDSTSGPSRKRSRKEGGQKVKVQRFKFFTWWDEMDCTTESKTDSSDNDDNNSGNNAGNSPVESAGPSNNVAEEDAIPGPFRKRKKKRDRVVDDEDDP